jgi:Holliday junction resolvase
MASKSKVKGSQYEREIVEIFKENNVDAERAWGSNGKSFGEHEEVDVKAGGLKLQLKRRKKIPQWIGLTEVVDAAILREDRGENYIILKLQDFIDLVFKK